jgi:hypothetical protein
MNAHLPIAGGGEYAVVAGTSTVIDARMAGSFRVLSSAKAFVGDPAQLGETATPVTLTAANATAIGLNMLYEFDLLPGKTRYIHIAGNGGAATVTVTLTS